jgi:hypothetical protein
MHLSEEQRLDKFRKPLSLSPVVLPSKQKIALPEGEKLDLALSGAAATFASSSFAHTFTRRSGQCQDLSIRVVHVPREGAFPVTPVFEPLFSQV